MIPVLRPYMGEEEVEAVAKVLRSGWIGLGPVTSEFEREFASYIGTPYMVALNSATAALELAVRLLDIGRGHEVIVPTMTFVSTAHAVMYNHATPIFADIDDETLSLDPADVARRITSRTRAIIVVHYGGRPVDMDALRAVAGNIPIIEDAAHAAGASYKGRKAGSVGDMGCFSFHAVKNLAAGDGGALSIHDEAMAHRAKRLRWLGIDKGTWDRSAHDRSYWWEYNVDEIGYKNHMNDINAAIALVQLGKLDANNARRRDIAARYSEGLADLPWLRVPPADTEDIQSAWHIYCVRCDQRDDLSVFLQERGIGTGVHYKPIHYYRCYGNTPHLPQAEESFRSVLSLPMHPALTDENVEFIIESVRAFPYRGATHAAALGDMERAEIGSNGASAKVAAPAI